MSDLDFLEENDFEDLEPEEGLRYVVREHGHGQVFVYNNAKKKTMDKVKKLIIIDRSLKERIDLNCAGSQVRAIETLLNFALDTLKNNNQDLASLY